MTARSAPRAIRPATSAWGGLLALAALLASGCGATTPPSAEPAADRRSPKRGVAYHFCGWDESGGRADLDALRPGITWTYDWSHRPMDCADGRGVGDALAGAGVEFVPMIWGLVDGGAACATGGPCFRVDHPGGGHACDAACAAGDRGPGSACYECRHLAVSRETLAAEIPAGARYLLAFNEPNFVEQANLTPEAAARAFTHVEWVADRRGLTIVGPGTNFCDPAATEGPAACVRDAGGDPVSHLVWLERFYDACSVAGVAGRDCRIEHQATHAYSCESISWAVTLMKIKAGLTPPTAAHCTDGARSQDEDGVDCGGMACPACTARARAVFARPIWLTEFANARWGGCEDLDTDALRDRALPFLRTELAALEAEPLLFRYAWFMPKAGGELDHADLLVEDRDGVRTPLGDLYVDAPF